MKFNPIGTINRWFGNKKFLIAFSIVCAVIFWLVIDITENPTREITVTDLKVSVANQTNDSGSVLMALGDTEREVSVTVSGPGYIVSNVTKNDISVSVVSYSDVNRPGTYVLNLTASVGVSGCQISKISPSYIQVNYDYDTSTEIPVEIDFSSVQQVLTSDREIYKSSLKSNADGADIPLLHISGPSEVVASVKKIVAVPKFSTTVLPETQNCETELKFYDSLGNLVDSSQLVYNRDIYARIVVYKVAEVGLKPTFENLPLCYSTNPLEYSLYRYSDKSRAKEKMSTVKVRGPIDTIDGLLTSGLSLSAIDFMKVTSNSTSFNVSFILPEGVEVVDGTEEVTVALKFGRLATANIELEPSNIQFIGLPQGMTANSVITNKSIKVKVCYDRNKTSKVTAKDFNLTVDLTGITTASTVTKTIKVTAASASCYAWAISVNPAETNIEIK